MIKAETIGLFIAVLSFFITIGSIVWKVSATVSNLKLALKNQDAAIARELAAMKTELRELILKVQHDLELRSSEMGHFDDKLMLGINGAREMAAHVRERTDKTHQEVISRLSDLEQFLAKHMEFERRR